MKNPTGKTLAGCRGFTMFELIVVIVILGILALIAEVINLSSQQNIDAVAKLLRSNIQFAQELAMTQGSAFGFHVRSSTQYEIFTGAAGSPATNPLDNTSFVVTTSPVQFSATPADISFASSGNPGLSADEAIKLTDGTNTRTITVQQNTGFVTITSP